MAHFNLLSFRKGGLTWGQLSRLYQLGRESEVEEFKLQARLHGAKFEEAEPSSASRQNPTHLPSPAEIKDMSPEERDRVTEQLMGRMASMGVAVKG